MNRQLAVAMVLVALLTVPAAAAAPFYAQQGDQQRTGSTADPGPDTWDVAYRVDLPGLRVPATAPVIHDGMAYVVTHSNPTPVIAAGGAAWFGRTALWQIDLHTATVSALLELPPQRIVGGQAADESGLYFLGIEGAYGTDYAGKSWGPTPFFVGAATQFPNGEPGAFYCRAGVVTTTAYIVACSFSGGWQATAYDRIAGRHMWTFGPSDLPGQANSALALAEPLAELGHLILYDDQVIVPILYGGGEPGVDGISYHVLDTETGAKTGGRAFDSPGYESLAGRAEPSAELGDYLPQANMVVLNDQIVIQAPDGVYFIDIASGQLRFMGLPDWARSAGVQHMAAVGPHLFLARNSGLVSIDVRNQRLEWPPTADAAFGVGGLGDQTLLHADGRLVATAADGALYIIDAAGPEMMQAIGTGRLGATASEVAIGDGLTVHVGGGTFSSYQQRAENTVRNVTTVAVLGHTAASIVAQVSDVPRFPALGQSIVVDAAGSRPGRLADDLMLSVDWGDGTVTDAEDLSAEHAYSAAGVYVVDIRLSNNAGQERSTQRTVEVAGTPPNFISTAFAPDNQESTFFLLGVIVILLGAAFGAARLRRKRGRLRKELAAADAIVRDRSDVDTMRAGLADHRRRAQRLFLEGRLDEGSTSILRGHIDELLRDHRLSSVEADLSFLPHGLFRSMQEMLRDAKVTQLERNNFLAALSAEQQLSAGQKARVKKHIDTWHREDAA